MVEVLPMGGFSYLPMQFKGYTLLSHTILCKDMESDCKLAASLSHKGMETITEI